MQMNDKPDVLERSPDESGITTNREPIQASEKNASSGTWALPGLLLLAVLTLLYLARELVLPVVAALILSLVFLPLVRGMKKILIPAPLGAGLVVLGLLAGLVGGIYNLADPASEWLDKAPQSLREIDSKLRTVTGSVHNVATATAQVQDITEKLTNGGETKKKPREVIVKEPTIAGAFFYSAKDFTVSIISTLVLLYFLLASGDLFLRKTIAVTPRFSDKKRAVDIAEQVEAAVSRYLFTVAFINVCLGCAVTLAMYLLGVPNPVLWGVMVCTLNFIPYIGDIISFSVLTVVGLLTFDQLWQSLLVPGVFYLLTAIEGYLITPIIVSRRLSLNPVVIILSVLFWGWMWGVAGALLAVPILVALKTVCDRVDSLHVFGEYLGE
ncbi:MAG TPA: AI-2E family transporter [Arenimonas sp.]|nr:AI-2E family transporter [Arenimonas sp.]